MERIMTPRIALIGGQGWPATETVWGLPTLERRFHEVGFEAQQFSHLARQEIRDYLRASTGLLGLIGDSLGAGAAALYPLDLQPSRYVTFVGGFQPSAWDPIGQGPTSSRTIKVAPNVRFAHCIWDPIFTDTAGLGNAHYMVTPGSKTTLTLTEHRGAHPDDWGWAQDLMFAHAVAALKEQS